MKKYIVPSITTLIVFLAPTLAHAAPSEGPANGVVAMATAIAIGLAAIGGGLGQGRAAAAALEGIARNPNSSGKVFVPMLLGLAFIESLVIFALLIAFQLVDKV